MLVVGPVRKMTLGTVSAEDRRERAERKSEDEGARYPSKVVEVEQERPAAFMTSPLTDEERDTLRQILLSDRARTMRSMTSLADTFSSHSMRVDSTGDMADVSSDVANLESATLISDRTSMVMQQIDAAIRRLTETPERFGICEVSGQPIPFSRLEVDPTVRTRREFSRV